MPTREPPQYTVRALIEHLQHVDPDALVFVSKAHSAHNLNSTEPPCRLLPGGVQDGNGELWIIGEL